MSDDQNSSESPTFSNRGRGRGRGRRRSRGRGNRSRHQDPRKNAPRANSLTIYDSSSSQTIPADADSVIPTLTFVNSRISSDPTPPSKLTLSSLSISNDNQIQQTSSTLASFVNKNKFSSRNQRQFRENKLALQTKDLVQELVFFQGFSTDIATLSTNFDRDAMEVETRINTHKGIFSTTMGNSSNKLLVKLDPKIKFCSNYIDPTGCHKKNCFDIHTCHYNLFDSCHEKKCLLEHNLKNNHNNRILHDFYLEDVSTCSLKDILKQIIQGSVYPRVCFAYQNEFCEAGQSCKHLHICYQLVLSLGTCPNMDNCSLNHNIHDPFCITIFNRFNIPTNETPRDLLKLLVNKLEQTESDPMPRRMEKKITNQDKNDSDWSNCSSEMNSVNSSSNSIKNSTASKWKGREGCRKKEQLKDYKLKKDSCERDHFSLVKNIASNENLSKIHKQNEIPTAKSYPVCDWKIKGDVESPFICIANLHGKCEDMKTVCKYLHSKRIYQWQFGDEKNWFNFHAFHADIIQRHFRDVSCDVVVLPAINPSLCSNMKDMPRILGTSPLKIDFTKMTLSGDYLKENFLIRHLTTTSTAINNDKFSTIFNWFFKNDEDKWQLYETNDKCEVSSDHIEKAYLSGNNVFHFKRKKFTYVLDFCDEVQVNESTRKIRAIRRRPEAFPYNELSFTNKAANLSKSQKQNEIPTSKSFPVCDWKIEGDVESPYICIPNLHGKCEDMATVCKYLHSKRTYQWQFGDKNWFNFHAFHAEIIERHFRDVSCDVVVLPAINPSLCSNMKDMPRILGTLPLKIDFTRMTLSGDYLKKSFLIRHLTTPSTAINNDKYSTIFNWFFKNDKDKWQLYEINNKCEVSSDHVEKAYLSDSNVFQFKGKKYTYVLDFGDEVQVNESTRKIRAIRRRPRAFPYNESLFANKASLPNNWNPVNASKGYNLISLNETEAEYKDVRKLFKINTENYKIPGIFRIQNELLWRQFDNKKNELKVKYPLQTLKVQKLFHCVDEKHFEEVCKENLDFRIHNESSDKKFGQGAYFFRSATVARKNCNSGIKKKLLIFDVIIGQTVKGDPSMTRPPDNNVYNALYDTTVDDVSCPTTFVKYNKHEYYPSYAVVLRRIKSSSSP